MNVTWHSTLSLFQIKMTSKCIELKHFLKMNRPPGSGLFEGYFQFIIHHSGSEETISLIDLLFATDFHKRKGEELENAVVNIYRTMTYGMILMTRRVLCLTRITPNNIGSVLWRLLSTVGG